MAAMNENAAKKKRKINTKTMRAARLLGIAQRSKAALLNGKKSQDVTLSSAERSLGTRIPASLIGSIPTPVEVYYTHAVGSLHFSSIHSGWRQGSVRRLGVTHAITHRDEYAAIQSVIKRKLTGSPR